MLPYLDLDYQPYFEYHLRDSSDVKHHIWSFADRKLKYDHSAKPWYKPLFTIFQDLRAQTLGITIQCRHLRYNLKRLDVIDADASHTCVIQYSTLLAAYGTISNALKVRERRQAEGWPGRWPHFPSWELEDLKFLIDGFLLDHRFFQPFGLEKLHAQGILTSSHLGALQYTACMIYLDQVGALFDGCFPGDKFLSGSIAEEMCASKTKLARDGAALLRQDMDARHSLIKEHLRIQSNHQPKWEIDLDTVMWFCSAFGVTDDHCLRLLFQAKMYDLFWTFLKHCIDQAGTQSRLQNNTDGLRYSEAIISSLLRILSEEEALTAVVAGGQLSIVEFFCAGGTLPSEANIEFALQDGKWAMASVLLRYSAQERNESARRRRAGSRLRQVFGHLYRFFHDGSIKQDASIGFARVGLKYLDPDIMWKEGIATIRQTIKGRPPVHLEQIISCLLAAAAMQLCGVEYGLDDQLGNVEQFLLDLPRWRHSVGNESDRIAYDEITAAVWGALPATAISPEASPGPLDVSYLDAFRTLISNLVMGIGSLNLSPVSDANEHQPHPFPTQRETEHPCPGSDRGSGNSPPVLKGRRQKENIVSTSELPLRNEECRITRVTLLMAGVIFGVILAFMLIAQFLFINQVPEDFFSSQQWQDIKCIRGIAWHSTKILAHNCRLLALCIGLNTVLPLQCDARSKAHLAENEGHSADQDVLTDLHPNGTTLSTEDSLPFGRVESRSFPLSVLAIDENSPSSATISGNAPTTLSTFATSPNQATTKPKNRCSDCDQSFSSRGNLNKHRKKYHPPSGLQQRFICQHCSKSYNEQWYLKKHMEERCKNLRRKRQATEGIPNVLPTSLIFSLFTVDATDPLEWDEIA